jgi:hypothetical protein
MKQTTPCTVFYITPSKWMRRWFADKSEAAKWVLKRIDDPKFRFRMIAGSTWQVTSMDTIKEWAL